MADAGALDLQFPTRDNTPHKNRRQGTAATMRLLMTNTMRTLLHGAAHGADEGMEQGVDTLPLRIAAIFVIGVVSFLVMLPPIVLRAFSDPDAAIGRLAAGSRCNPRRGASFKFT